MWPLLGEAIGKECIFVTNEELKESLLMAPKNGYARITAQQRVEMEA